MAKKRGRWTAACCTSTHGDDVQFLEPCDVSELPADQQEALPMSSSNLQQFVARLLRRLAAAQLGGLIFFLKVLEVELGGKMAYATMCSGSEAPVVCIMALAAALGAIGLNMASQQVFGCEVNEDKLNFISMMLPGVALHLFKDANGLSFRYAKDFITRVPVLVPGCFLLLAGFPCTDVSSKNPKHKEHGNICRDEGGKTGSVFAAIIAYLAAHPEVAIVIFENVMGLLKGSNIATIKARLLEVGFCFRAWVLCPTFFGGTQQRGRVWMICFRLSYFDGSNEDALWEVAQSVMSASVGHPATALDDTLLLDNHWAVQTFNKIMSQKKAAPLPHLVTDKKLLHRDTKCWKQSLDIAMAKGHVREWMAGTFQQELTPDLLDAFPGLREVTTRQWDVLQAVGVKSLPEHTSRVLDITQSPSMSAPAVESSNCITPQGIQFHTKKCRRFLGMEAMRLQNIWYPDQESLYKMLAGGEHGENPEQFLKLDRLLTDMGGNAFNANCCVVTVLAALVAAGCVLKRIHEEKHGPEKCTSLSSTGSPTTNGVQEVSDAKYDQRSRSVWSPGSDDSDSDW